MIKTDLRHSNNRSANRNLHTELDLWLAYKENNSEPLLLGKAISQKQKGDAEDSHFEMYYSPVDRFKSRPYLLIGTNNDWECRYSTISQAKYYLKSQYNNVKWLRK